MAFPHSELFSFSLRLHYPYNGRSLSFLSLSLSHTHTHTHTRSNTEELAMAVTLAIALRTLFGALGLAMTAVLVYTIVVDGLPFRKALLTPWMAATLVDLYINTLAIVGAWVIYKESNWLSALVWLVLLVCLGSVSACGYVVLQFLRLSPQESLQDPIYFVLLRHQKKDGVEQRRKFSVVTARVVFSGLGCLMLATLVYTIVTDGSPFRKELLTPWMNATLVDFYINVVALSVWVVYKESSWISTLFWVVLLICFGSITTCVYIVIQLFHISSQDPVYLVLFSSRNRAENRYDIPLRRGDDTTIG